MNINTKDYYRVCNDLRLIISLFILLIGDLGSATEQWVIELEEMSLEELTSIQVTSVSKKSEKLKSADAAIYVITSEDIRRSGAITLPEVFRMVPGIDVARINGNYWAISAHGFNNQLANKLLVLIDGRAIYTPLFSGVYWEIQDYPLEDIERIEVIRGPGGSLWGANAMDGIINIITKHSRETTGGLITGVVSNDNYGAQNIRLGNEINENLHIRTYGKLLGKNTSYAQSDTHDDGRFERVGMRLDWNPVSDSSLFMDMGYHNSEIGDNVSGITFTPPFIKAIVDDRRYTGAHFLTRWSKTVSPRNDYSLQLFYDFQNYDLSILDEKRHTFDLDFQQHLVLGQRHDLIWGMGYRYTEDKTRPSDSQNIRFIPSAEGVDLFSSFIQDDISIYEDKLTLTLGSKFEYNDYTHFEFQPNVRITLNPNGQHTLWAAVSRAVRTPSRAENDVDISLLVFSPTTGPTPIRVVGAGDVQSEELIAYEAGYRIKPRSNLSFDFVLFFNDYDKLVTTDFINPTTLEFNNFTTGETYGGEILNQWKPWQWWLLESSYSYLNIQLHGGTETAEGDSPNHKVTIRSLIDLPHNWEIDTAVRYVDTLASQNNPSYIVMDLRLGWRPSKSFDISVGAQNLLDNHHPEFGEGQFLSQITEVRTNYYAKVSYRF